MLRLDERIIEVSLNSVLDLAKLAQMLVMLRHLLNCPLCKGSGGALNFEVFLLGQGWRVLFRCFQLFRIIATGLLIFPCFSLFYK